MNVHNDGFVAFGSSALGLILAQVSASIQDENIMSLITAITALILCATSVVRFISYSLEEIPKIKGKLKELKWKIPTKQD